MADRQTLDDGRLRAVLDSVLGDSGRTDAVMDVVIAVVGKRLVALEAENAALAAALAAVTHEYVATSDSPFMCAGSLGVHPQRCAFPSDHRIHQTPAVVRRRHSPGTEQ